MSKRKETTDLEKALEEHTRLKRAYGCEEITIGFANSGHGNEIVDFMTMEAKGIIRCYEIKVTLQDLKSKAKKSWYGHYNYLVVSTELYDKISDWDKYIPPHIGIIAGTSLESKRKAKKQEVDIETEIMLKESMVRSMFWKMDKYRDAQSIEKQRKMQAEIRRLEKENKNISRREHEAQMIISIYETYKYYNDGIDVDLKKMAEEEKRKYREKMRKQREGS